MAHENSYSRRAPDPNLNPDSILPGIGQAHRLTVATSSAICPPRRTLHFEPESIAVSSAAVKRTVLIPALLLAAFALTRWPGVMPVNFSLGYGLVFCAGAFPNRLPWWAVFSTLIGTDIGLNVLYYDQPPLADYHLVNYLGFGALYFMGRLFARRASVLKHIGGSLLGAILFYLITNTGAWLENPTYAKSLAEWFRALTTGTIGWPETWTFFRNTLLSSGLFAGLISAALQASEVKEPELEEEPEPETAPEAAPEEAK